MNENNTYQQLWDYLRNDVLDEKTSWGKEILKKKMDEIELIALRDKEIKDVTTK